MQTHWDACVSVCASDPACRDINVYLPPFSGIWFSSLLLARNSQTYIYQEREQMNYLKFLYDRLWDDQNNQEQLLEATLLKFENVMALAAAGHFKRLPVILHSRCWQARNHSFRLPSALCSRIMYVCTCIFLCVSVFLCMCTGVFLCMCTGAHPLWVHVCEGAGTWNSPSGLGWQSREL